MPNPLTLRRRVRPTDAAAAAATMLQTNLGNYFVPELTPGLFPPQLSGQAEARGSGAPSPQALSLE